MNNATLRRAASQPARPAPPIDAVAASGLNRVIDYSNAALIAELRRVAAIVEGHFSMTTYKPHARIHSATVVVRFGSWRAALKKAGLSRRCLPRRKGARHTWESCHANMEKLFRHYGRAPTAKETDKWPSTVGSGTYFQRFRNWRNMLAAFVAYRNGDTDAWPMPGSRPGKAQRCSAYCNAQRIALDRRKRSDDAKRAAEEAEMGLPGPATISGLLRYRVLARDEFRCVACGASPANTAGVKLHVDHKIPRAKGGRTVIDNLRTLCVQCNVGKGAEMV